MLLQQPAESMSEKKKLGDTLRTRHEKQPKLCFYSSTLTFNEQFYNGGEHDIFSTHSLQFALIRRDG